MPRIAASVEPRVHIAPNGFTWHVELPDRTNAPLGGRKPRAALCIDSAAAQGEPIMVPCAAARLLDARFPQDVVGPTFRAELLFELRGCSVRAATDRLVRLVDRRDYSCREVLDKLRLDGYTTEVSEEVISKAREGHVLDDVRFADVFIRTKVSSGWGTMRIERELSRRGIDPSDVGGWPDAYLEPEGELDRALSLIESRRIPDRNPYQKYVRFLATRGFPLSVAKAAASRRLDEAMQDQD